MTHPPCISCDGPVPRRPDEQPWQWKRRRTCNPECVARKRAANAPFRPQRKPVELAEDLEWLLETGENWVNIPARLGVNERTMLRSLRRAGREDLWETVRAVKERV